MTPFKYDAVDDKVKYLGNFRHLNPDLFKTEHQDKLDSERVARYTTWTPNSEAELSNITPFREKIVPEERIDLVISAVAWSTKNCCVNIGVYNSHPECVPVPF